VAGVVRADIPARAGKVVSLAGGALSATALTAPVAVVEVAAQGRGIKSAAPGVKFLRPVAGEAVLVYSARVLQVRAVPGLLVATAELVGVNPVLPELAALLVNVVKTVKSAALAVMVALTAAGVVAVTLSTTSVREVTFPELQVVMAAPAVCESCGLATPDHSPQPAQARLNF